jgi:hypothetical protein
MSRRPRPTVGDLQWANWIRRFPGQPERTRYSLEWMVGRLLQQKALLPDPKLLSPGERKAVYSWLDSFEFEFGLEQEDPVRLVEPLAATGVLGILVGVVSAPFVPPVSIGLFVASTGLLGAGAASKLDERKRKELVKRIKLLLRDLRDQAS